MSEESRRVTVIGSANVDLVVEVERFPQPGETLSAASSSVGPGGKGANQALAASRVGADVRFVGAVGDDEHGRVALSLLRESGVDLDGVALADAPTGAAHITVDSRGENTIVVDAGANARVDAQAVAKLGDLADVVVLQGEIPRDGIEAAARQTVAGGGRLVLNLAPVVDVDPAVIRAADPVVANEHEICLLAEMLGGEGNDRDAAVDTLLDAGVESVVVTLGGAGSLVAVDGKRTHVDAPSVQAVDTTGAGDAFTGALAAALARGEAVLDAARFATRFAALTVMRRGAQASYPQDVDAMPALPG